MYITNKEKFNQ